MTDIAALRAILRDGAAFLNTVRRGLVERDCLEALEGRERFEIVEVLTGVRRSGKSTVLHEVGRRLMEKGMSPIYINFEDDRLIPAPEDFQSLLSLIEADEPILLLDEPQNMPGWEKWVRRLHDRGMKVYLTGSNSRLLSSELATALSGRSRTHEVFPLSFGEFLKARTSGPLMSDRLTGQLEEYLTNGGFPYPTVSGDSIHADYRRDIVERDIIYRHRMTDPERFRTLVSFILSNPGIPLSRKRARGLLEIHHTTMRKYLGYMEEAFLVIALEKHGRSRRVSIQNPKKVYPIDNGLLLDKSGKGLLLESVLVQHLRRQFPRLCYWKDERGREVDIYVPERNLAIQVVYEVNSQNIAREEAALESAVRELDCQGLLVFMYKRTQTAFDSINATEFLQGSLP